MKTKTGTTEQGQAEQAQQATEQKDAVVDQFLSRLFSDGPRDKRMAAMFRLDAELSAFDD